MLDNAEITRAGFGPRAAAYLLDRLILALALGFIRVPSMLASLFGGGAFTFRAFLFQYSALDVLCWVLSCVYFILLTYCTGSTLGKKVMRLRVESADGEPLRLIDVIYRETVGRFLSGIFCLGYLMILADREKRGFHDWLCATRVVYEGVAFKPRAPKHSAAYSVPGAPAQEAPAAAPASYSVPGPSGYSIPGAAPVPAAVEEVPVPEEIEAEPAPEHTFPAEDPREP